MAILNLFFFCIARSDKILDGFKMEASTWSLSLKYTQACSWAPPQTENIIHRKRTALAILGDYA